MILLIGGEKGGSGKSCLAQNLAIYLKKHRGMDVLILDADPQGTTTDWVQERAQDDALETIHCVQASGNIRKTLQDLDGRYQAVVVDAGGQDSEALRSALTVAHYALLPFRPKRRDLKTLPHAEELIKTAKAINPDLVARAVITQCPTLPSQIQRILDAKEACRSFNVEPLNAFTYNRNIYDDADEGGLSVLETGSDEKARAEIIAIAEELLN
ncbi:MAG: AAA family ATPase [Candidatus Competibacteraceae bacterium]|nr:AAA family ATPase [Candidatus Competibacteraceae bacterium]